MLLLLGAQAWHSGQEDACCPRGPPLPVLSLLMGFWVCAMDMVVLVWTGCPGCHCPSTDVVVLVWEWFVPVWTGCPRCHCPGVGTCVPM